MTELERDLLNAGAELDWPPTPDLARPVVSRLDDRGAERAGPGRGASPHRRLPLRRPLLVAIVCLLILAGAVAAAVPAARDAVLDLLGLQGATVERRDRLPRAAPGGRLELGERVGVDDAARAVGFDPLVPRALPPPDAAYVRRRATPGGELSLAYRPGPGLPRAQTTNLGLLVSEFRGDLHPDYLGKIAGQATRVERVDAGGSPGIWIEGAPHLFFYRDARGEFREDRLRLAGNVLLVERGDLLLRLEGAFSLPRALELAESLAP